MTNPLKKYGDARKERIDQLAAMSDGSVAVADAGTIEEAPGVSLIASAWRRLRRNPVFLTGLTITTLFIFLAVFARVIAPTTRPSATCSTRCAHSPTRSRARSPAFPWARTTRDGTSSPADRGLQQTLIVGVFATLFGLAGGLILGILAGATSGWVDSPSCEGRRRHALHPSLLLALSISALAPRPSQWTLIIAIATVQVPVFARLLRGTMLQQRSSDHVLAARALGIKRSSIVFRHMVPNALDRSSSRPPSFSPPPSSMRRPVLPRPGQPGRPPTGMGPDARAGPTVHL